MLFYIYIPPFVFNLKLIKKSQSEKVIFSEAPRAGAEGMEEDFVYIYDLKNSSDYLISRGEIGRD